MVQGTIDFSEVARTIVRLLAEAGITVQQLYLYGSCAAGTMRDGSDVDVVIVSKDFERYDPLTRLEFLSRLLWKCPWPIEALGYTPAEVQGKENKSILWDEVRKHGQIIYKAA